MALVRRCFSISVFFLLSGVLAFLTFPSGAMLLRTAGVSGNRSAGPLTGGPDAFGYTYDATVPFSWVDTAGAATIPGGDDFYRGPYAIGFTFYFYGAAHSEFWVNTNGLILFDGKGSGQMEQYLNTFIPSASTPNHFAAVFWDDLKPLAGGEIRYVVVGAFPRRSLVVEWRDVGHFSDFDHKMTFQAIFYEASNEIRFQYLSVQSSLRGDGSSATIGIENASGQIGLQYSFEQPSLRDGLAISFRHPDIPPVPTPTGVPGDNFPICTADRPQHRPAAAAGPADRTALVVWEDYRAGPNIADLYGIVMTPFGAPASAEIPIAVGGLNQLSPKVAYNTRDSEYLAVWHEREVVDGQQRFRIYGQRVSSRGTLLGQRLPIAVESDWQMNAGLAYNSIDNQYLIAWEDGAVNIWARLLSAAGGLLGQPFVVCNAPGHQTTPSVTHNPDRDEYLVIWRDLGRGGIHAQRLSARGDFYGEDITIGGLGGESPAVDYGVGARNYLVVAYGSLRGDPGVCARILSEFGAQPSEVLCLFSARVFDYFRPDVAYHPTRREYLVAWFESRRVTPDSYLPDLFAQRVSEAGALIGPSVSLSRADYDQRDPAIATLSGTGSWLVAWEDYRTGELDIWGTAFPPPSEPAQLRFEPDVALVPAHTEAFTLPMRLEDVRDLGGFRFTLRYDPIVVHVNSIELGAFLSTTARVFDPVGPRIDNATGIATFGANSSNPASVLRGSGTVAVVHFSTVRPGRSTLHLEDVHLTEHGGAEMTITANDGEVTVEGTATPTWTPTPTLTSTSTLTASPTQTSTGTSQRTPTATLTPAQTSTVAAEATWTPTATLVSGVSPVYLPVLLRRQDS